MPGWIKSQGKYCEFDEWRREISRDNNLDDTERIASSRREPRNYSGYYIPGLAMTVPFPQRWIYRYGLIRDIIFVAKHRTRNFHVM